MHDKNTKLLKFTLSVLMQIVKQITLWQKPKNWVEAVNFCNLNLFQDHALFMYQNQTQKCSDVWCIILATA